MHVIRANEMQEVSGGGVVFLIPPAVTIGVKVIGIAVGIISSSISIFAAYQSLK